MQVLVVHAAGAEHFGVGVVVDGHEPREAVALARKLVDRALHVARAEVQQWPRGHRGIADLGAADVEASGVHVGQDAAEVLAQEADLERPRGARVANRDAEVGHAAEHQPFERDGLGQAHRLSVHAQRDAAEREKVEACGRNNHVGLDLGARGQAHAALGKRLNAVGHDRGVAFADRAEQVAVWDQAQALVPRVVRRVEVHVHGVALGQQLSVDPPDKAPRRLGIALAKPPHEPLLRDVLAPHGRVRAPVGKQPPRDLGERVHARNGEHVRGRALEHRDVRRAARGHRGHERNRRRPAANDDDALAGVVQILGPVLRVDDLAREPLAALEARRKAFVVAVVAAGGEQPSARELRALARGLLHLDRPPSLWRGPRRADHLVVQTHVLAHAVRVGRLAQIAQDVVGTRDGGLGGPRFELVAERVEVGVGADAGVAEEVPRAARRAARLQNGVGGAGPVALEVVRRAQAREAGADDEHVEVFHEWREGGAGLWRAHNANARAAPRCPGTASNGRPPEARQLGSGARSLWRQRLLVDA